MAVPSITVSVRVTFNGRSRRNRERLTDENHVFLKKCLLTFYKKNPHLLSAIRNLEKSEIQRFKLTRKYLDLTVVAINITITNIKKVVCCYVSNHCCLLVVCSWIGTHS